MREATSGAAEMNDSHPYIVSRGFGVRGRSGGVVHCSKRDLSCAAMHAILVRRLMNLAVFYTFSFSPFGVSAASTSQVMHEQEVAPCCMDRQLSAACSDWLIASHFSP